MASGISLCIRDLVIPFGHRHGDPNHVCFLESIGTQQLGGYLPCDADHRCGIDHVHPLFRSDQVGSAGARSGHTYSNLVGYPVHSPGRHGSLPAHALPVHVLSWIHTVFIQIIVGGHDGSTRISEYGIDTLPEAGTQNYGLSTGYGDGLFVASTCR